MLELRTEMLFSFGVVFSWWKRDINAISASCLHPHREARALVGSDLARSGSSFDMYALLQEIMWSRVPHKASLVAPSQR